MCTATVCYLMNVFSGRPQLHIVVAGEWHRAGGELPDVRMPRLLLRKHPSSPELRRTAALPTTLHQLQHQRVGWYRLLRQPIHGYQELQMPDSLRRLLPSGPRGHERGRSKLDASDGHPTDIRILWAHKIYCCCCCRRFRYTFDFVVAAAVVVVHARLKWSTSRNNW